VKGRYPRVASEDGKFSSVKDLAIAGPPRRPRKVLRAGALRQDSVPLSNNPYVRSCTCQPNIRRTFPGTSTRNDDVEDDESEDEEEEDNYQQPVYRGGGKQLGKAFRPPSEDDDDDDSEEDDPETQFVAPRGSGKQLGGGGKYLRP